MRSDSVESDFARQEGRIGMSACHRDAACGTAVAPAVVVRAVLAAVVIAAWIVISDVIVAVVITGIALLGGLVSTVRFRRRPIEDVVRQRAVARLTTPADQAKGPFLAAVIASLSIPRGIALTRQLRVMRHACRRGGGALRVRSAC